MAFSQQFIFHHWISILDDPQSDEATIVNTINNIKNDINIIINTEDVPNHIKMMQSIIGKNVMMKLKLVVIC